MVPLLVLALYGTGRDKITAEQSVPQEIHCQK